MAELLACKYESELVTIRLCVSRLHLNETSALRSNSLTCVFNSAYATDDHNMYVAPM